MPTLEELICASVVSSNNPNHTELDLHSVFPVAVPNSVDEVNRLLGDASNQKYFHVTDNLGSADKGASARNKQAYYRKLLNVLLKNTGDTAAIAAYIGKLLLTVTERDERNIKQELEELKKLLEGQNIPVTHVHMSLKYYPHIFQYLTVQENIQKIINEHKNALLQINDAALENEFSTEAFRPIDTAFPVSQIGAELTLEKAERESRFLMNFPKDEFRSLLDSFFSQGKPASNYTEILNQAQIYAAKVSPELAREIQDIINIFRGHIGDWQTKSFANLLNTSYPSLMKNIDKIHPAIAQDLKDCLAILRQNNKDYLSSLPLSRIIELCNRHPDMQKRIFNDPRLKAVIKRKVDSSRLLLPFTEKRLSQGEAVSLVNMALDFGDEAIANAILGKAGWIHLLTSNVDFPNEAFGQACFRVMCKGAQNTGKNEMLPTMIKYCAAYSFDKSILEGQGTKGTIDKICANQSTLLAFLTSLSPCKCQSLQQSQPTEIFATIANKSLSGILDQARSLDRNPNAQLIVQGNGDAGLTSGSNEALKLLVTMLWLQRAYPNRVFFAEEALLKVVCSTGQNLLQELTDKSMLDKSAQTNLQNILGTCFKQMEVQTPSLTLDPTKGESFADHSPSDQNGSAGISQQQVQNSLGQSSLTTNPNSTQDPALWVATRRNQYQSSSHSTDLDTHDPVSDRSSTNSETSSVLVSTSMAG